MEEEKQNGREFWERVLKEDRYEMNMIDAEIRLNSRKNEKYKPALNLIGRDLMFARTHGINVDEDYVYLQSLRERCY